MTRTQPAAAAELDGGDMDCGSGLLLLLTRSIRRIEAGEVLRVRTREPSVPPDLVDWARLAGHSIVASDADAPGGPWQVLVRRGGVAPATVFTGGQAPPLGQRLWLYSNFHCNLACNYCCSQSSPGADARLLPVAVAVQAADEMVALGGRELIVTGGEPFLHPDLAHMIGELAERLPVTLLTNAMVFERGARRAALEAMPRDQVVLQVSVDSAEPELHDRHRGRGSHARALAGIRLASSLGFRVRVAATLYESEASSATALHALLDTLDVEDRLIRPVAAQGFAEQGQKVTVDSLEPEPTLAADGIWWHPVAVTDPAMRVADAPLPLAGAFEVMRETLAVTAAAHREGRAVFRCV